MTGVIRYIVTRDYDLNASTIQRLPKQVPMRPAVQARPIADQVLEPIDCFCFRDIEFPQRFANIEVHLAGRAVHASLDQLEYVATSTF
jgi:hypothetical protein